MAFVVQSNFNRGELSPELALRDDLEHYYAGLKEATNVLSIPQGGIKRRPGLQYYHTLAGKARLASFEFNRQQVYVLAFSAGLVEIFQSTTKIGEVVTPYTEDELFDLYNPVRWAQQADTMIIVHGNHPPMKLVRRIGPPETWTLFRLIDFGSDPAVDESFPLPWHYDSSDPPVVIDDPANENIPRFNFEDSDTPDETDEVQRILFTNTWASGDTYRLKLGDERTDAYIILAFLNMPFGQHPHIAAVRRSYEKVLCRPLVVSEYHSEFMGLATFPELALCVDMTNRYTNMLGTERQQERNQ